jgi:hypothetical protein
VRYLAALGLETHLAKYGEAASWHDAAQAGLEDLPVSTMTTDLPYVVKSPWAYQLVEEVLADPEIRLDAVIVPVRDLTEATASRTIVELQALHEEADWMASTWTTWEHWGTTPGGALISLNPIDQARLLAVGFHRLLERLTQADVPVVLLAFPRLASDADYLFGKLAPVLPINVSIERAREAHATTFSAAMVRVEGELSDEVQPLPVHEFQGPDLRALDNAALKRSLTQLRGQLRESEAKRVALKGERDTLSDQLEHQRAEAEAGRAASEHACDRLEQQWVQATAEAERQRRAREHSEREALALRESTSWRITWPLRFLSQAMRGAFRAR